jgi:hypothetical protein
VSWSWAMRRMAFQKSLKLLIKNKLSMFSKNRKVPAAA